jgi:hypothetical protein
MNCKTRRDEAEGGLIDLVRRNGAQNFLLTIVSADGAWRVEFVDLDADMHKTSGGGFSLQQRGTRSYQRRRRTPEAYGQARAFPQCGLRKI